MACKRRDPQAVEMLPVTPVLIYHYGAELAIYP